MRDGNTGMATSESSPCDTSDTYLAKEISDTSNSRNARVRKKISSTCNGSQVMSTPPTGTRPFTRSATWS